MKMHISKLCTVRARCVQLPPETFFFTCKPHGCTVPMKLHNAYHCYQPNLCLALWTKVFIHFFDRSALSA